jgi:hypothetical protein
MILPETLGHESSAEAAPRYTDVSGNEKGERHVRSPSWTLCGQSAPERGRVA